MPDESALHFGWVDYLIFTLTLTISLVIGIYHAWKGSANSTMEYLLGGKTMGIFPIAMSFAASTVSTQNMLGTPADVYFTGAMMFWMPVAFAIGALVGAYVFLPLFQELGVLSINEYLEMRYHRYIRRWFSGINIFGTLFWLSILTYGPSLALSQVTGLHVYLAATITFAVCTFYTTIGGMKAVVWSDTIQIFLMFGSMAILVIKGVMDVGINNVWERNLNSSRLELFNIDPDPTTQKTVWSMVIGFGLFWIGVSCSQGNFQRFLAVPSNNHAQKAVILNIFVVASFYVFCCSSGLVVYAKYFDCDPIKAKLIEKGDQIVPYFMMDTLGRIPGLPGLFVAGCFSASLSTMSTVLNGCALTILEDFVRPFFPHLTDKSATRISKSISFTFGLIGYIMVFLISNVNSILEAGLSIGGADVGMNLGMFTLGMLIPWSNTIGATVGMVVSYTAVILLGVFSQMASSQGTLRNRQIKPTSIENCENLNFTTGFYSNSTHQPIQEEAFYLLKISYIWYTLIGALIVLVVGTIVSLITGPQDPDQLDPKLVYPFMRRWIGKKRAPAMMLNMLHQEIDNNGKINNGFEN